MNSNSISVTFPLKKLSPLKSVNIKMKLGVNNATLVLSGLISAEVVQQVMELQEAV